MAVAEELQIIIDAKTDKARRELKATTKQMESAHKSGDQLAKLFKRGVGALAAAASFAALTRAIKENVKAYQEQEEAERALSAAAERNPLLDETAVASIEEFATELQRVSTVGDETALRLASVAASSGRTEEEIKNMVQAAADVSAALGITMDSAIRSLNKSFGGMTGELGELVPELQNLTKEQLEAGEGVDLVREMFDGAAEAMADTASGGLKQFNNAFGDLREQLGRSFLDRAEPVIGWLQDLVENATEAAEQTNNLRDALERIGSGEAPASLKQAQEDLAAIQAEIRELEQAEGAGARARLERLRQQEKAAIEQVKNLELVAYWEGRVKDETGELAEETNRLSQGQKDYIEISTKLKEELARIAERKELLGGQYDAEEAKSEAVLAALDELIERGYKVENLNIQTLLSNYEALIEKRDELARGPSSFNLQGPQGPPETEPTDLSGVAGQTSGAIEKMFAERQRMIEIQDEFYAEFHENELDRIEREKQAFIRAGVAKVDAEKWAQEQIRDEIAETAQERLDIVSGVFGQLSATANAYFELQRQQLQRTMAAYDDRMDTLREQHEEELEQARERGASAEALQDIREQQAQEEEKLEEKKLRRQNEIQRRLFMQEKALSIAEATINTAVSVVEGLSKGGPALAAAYGALGAAQIAAIAAQTFPALAEGGIVTKPTMALVGEKGPEAVIPLDKGGAGGPSITFNGDVNLYGAGGKTEFVEDIIRTWRRREARGLVA